jgi:ankyrin repeat protein
MALIMLACRIPAFCGEIHDAAKAGDLAKVKALLKDYPELVSSKDNVNITPLHWAAQFGHKGLVELLLAHGTDVNAKDNNGKTPMKLAAENCKTDVVELLRHHPEVR